MITNEYGKIENNSRDLRKLVLRFGFIFAESGELISEIRSLLNQTIQAYQQQNYAEAEALATTAYLDNFEFIEAPLAEKDEVLMENTEVMLREQLRQLIQNQVPAEQLQQHIDEINSNLDKAEQLLGVLLMSGNVPS